MTKMVVEAEWTPQESRARPECLASCEFDALAAASWRSIGIVDTLFRMVDVDELRGDIEIAHPDRRAVWIQGLEVSAQAPEPGEFQSAFPGKIE